MINNRRIIRIILRINTQLVMFTTDINQLNNRSNYLTNQLTN